MYKPGQILNVTVEKIVPNGFGLGFAENLTVFVALAAPGDRARVRINQLKGKTAFAEIVEIVEPSPERIAPPCEYFGRCGGCDFQQLDYAAQLRAKIDIVKDCLTRIGKLNYDGAIEIVGSPQSFGYRARAQWHADTRARRLGYFRRTSHHVIDVETCPILTEPLQKTLTGLRANLEWETFWAERIEIEAASAGERVSVFSDELVEPTEELDFALGEDRYFYDARSFFQGNPLLIESLVETALGGAAGAVAFDLYCGVGLFTLPLARNFETVHAVEASERSIGAARRNLDHARLDNVALYAEPVGEWLTREAPPAVDFVLLDPPRAGTEKETIDALLGLRPARISYVSCEPSTLARDLRRLCEDAYEIESITALDLFPQTHHVETVVRLRLKPNGLKLSEKLNIPNGLIEPG
ncbi:MAG: class I SAM-dependent RNA methyltransferase [Acidobacteria bacterium]|nr:class I SAM-dependent RNA methyltransferase [Acidobacteriota bacterium]